jgi:hypothetical protein
MRKYVLILCFLSTWYLSEAQAPLLPVLKDSTGWHISSSGMGGVLGIVTEETDYKIWGDTSINGKVFKLLQAKTNHCDRSPSGNIGPFCQIVSDTLFLRQVGNSVLTSANDTLFSMKGTGVGDSVLYLSRFYTITHIKTISIGSDKVRFFTLEYGKEYYAYYADGIGFLTSEPFASLATDIMHEMFFSLRCYQTASGESYRYSPIDTSFVPSTTACMILLSTDVEDSFTPIKIFVNEQNELILEATASQVDIYNSVGQYVMSGQNIQKIGLNGRNPGVYMAFISFGNRQVRYKFLLK